jgi:hypothetical protein
VEERWEWGKIPIYKRTIVVVGVLSEGAAAVLLLLLSAICGGKEMK